MTTLKTSKTRYLLSTALTATGLLALASSPALADNWTDLQGSGFSTDVSVPNTTNITQHVDIVKARGDLDINENYTVNVLQPGSTSLFAVWDIEGDPTYIMGRLNANGQILIVDQNGVFFGRNSVVNVGSIIATTGQIDEADINDGQFFINFEKNNPAFSGAGIKLEGVINVAEAGIAAFVAPSVQNSGVINAKLGKVAFAAGEKVTIDLYGDDLVSIAVDDKLGNALLENSGAINAEGGTVQMTANAAKNAVDNIINMDGVVDVSSVTVKGGKIILGGGSSGAVKVSGKLKADGKNGGGKIDVKGENVYVDSSAVLSADAVTKGDGGTVNVIAQNHADFRGTILARGGSESGDGGEAEVSGYGVLGYDGDVDLSAANGATGNLLLDPAFAVIHSGAIHDPLGLGYVLSAQRIANTMKTTNMTIQATNFIDVGTGFGPYNTGIPFINNILNALIGTGPINLSTWNNGGSGTVTNGLTLRANTINFNKDLTMGSAGVLNIDAVNVNLDSKIYSAGGAVLLGDARITSVANTVNVESSDASIQQGIWLTKDSGGTVNIAADTYQEQIIIDRNVSLIGADRDTTIIQSPTQLAQTGTSPNGAKNYGIIWAKNADVNISNLTIDGSTNAQAGAYNNSNRFIGIVYQNAGGTFENNRITDIQTAGNNTRSGFGLLATDNTGSVSTLNILNNIVDGFQSFGIALANSKLTAIVQGNAITGDKDNIGAEQSGLYVTAGAAVSAGGAAAGEENTFSDTDMGVTVIDTRNGVYQNNVLSNVHNGFVLDNADDTQLSGNIISGNSTVGITIDSSDGTVVSGGSVSNFDTGILVNNSDNVTIQNVTIYDILNGNAIDVNQSNSIDILTNYIGYTDAGVTEGAAGNINGNGVDLFESDFATVKGNKITQTATTGINIGSGINLKTSHDADIGGAGADENIITNTQWDGIRLSGSDRAEIRNNDIDNVVRTGIYAESSTDLIVNNNDVDDAGHDGIFIYGVNDASLTNNNIGTNGGANNIGQWGVHVTNGKDVRVAENRIFDTGLDGILASGVRTEVGDTYAIRIVDNTVRRAGDNGIRIINLRDSAGISGNGRALVDINDVRNVGDNGILVANSIVTATDNVVNNTGNSGTGDGIRLEKSTGSRLIGNEIGLLGNADNINGDGIYAELSDNLVIRENTIANTDSPANNKGSGIQLYKSNNATVAQNIISATDWDGIRLEISNGTTVRGNDIDNLVRTGIYAEFSSGLTITNNDVDSVGRDGVFIYGVTSSEVTDNNIGTNGGAYNIGQWGVHVTNGKNIIVDNNRIFDTGFDGILASGVGTQAGDTYAIEITDNTVRRAGDNGIRVINLKDSAGVSGNGRALIEDNFIRTTIQHGILVFNSAADVVANIINNTGNGKSAGNGIHLDQADNSSVRRNEIGLLGGGDNINGDGIYAQFSDNLTIRRNTIANTDSPSNNVGSGIQLYEVNGATIARNIISDTDWDGIRLENVSNVTVRRNEIDNIVRTGSYAEFSDNVVYDRNVIDNVGRDGIFLYGTTNSTIVSNRIGTNGGPANIGQWGVHLTNGSNIAIDSNRIFDANDGIIVSGTAVGAGPYAVTITDNIIRRSTQHGIELRNAGDSLITDNTVVNSGAVGILLSRFNNGQSTIAGNTVRLFDVGMQFESGVIDLTGAANTIENGNTGMLFKPYDLGGGNYAPLSLVENDAVGTSTPYAPGVTPTDFAGTLGNTIFNNISGQYVELDNFAFWDFVNNVPLWLDASTVTFDGIRPADFPGGILDPVTYGQIEDKMFHYPDGVRDVGIFFFGIDASTLSALTLDIDESQFFREFASFNGDISGLNIRILGLPNTGFGAPTITGGGLAGALNNIVPFAGGASNPANLNQIETAAGGTSDPVQSELGAQDPAAIEPAAGGVDSACWGDALATAQTGQAVNVVYSGSLDDALTSAAGCSTGAI